MAQTPLQEGRLSFVVRQCSKFFGQSQTPSLIKARVIGKNYGHMIELRLFPRSASKLPKTKPRLKITRASIKVRCLRRNANAEAKCIVAYLRISTKWQAIKVDEAPVILQREEEHTCRSAE